MATVFEVHCEHDDERYAAQAAQAAFDEVDRLERELSRFVPNSDIGRINDLAAGERTQVSPSTLECLVIARHVFALTGGAFDVSMGTGLASLEIDPGHLLVSAAKAGVRLDLGGIGKGYAVDRMGDVLEEWGLVRALAHGGFSSVLALEPPAGCDGWALTLSDPAAHSRVLAQVRVRQTALAASGVRKGDHILDPLTGEPARERRAVWSAVRRPDTSLADAAAQASFRVSAAAVADALATAFMVMRLDDIETLCARSPGLEAWMLAEPGGNDRPGTELVHVGGPPADF
jgi:thiamine biosynthesis lipoprotein